MMPASVMIIRTRQYWGSEKQEPSTVSGRSWGNSRQFGHGRVLPVATGTHVPRCARERANNSTNVALSLGLLSLRVRWRRVTGKKPGL